jgi:hypothetical protein
VAENVGGELDSARVPLFNSSLETGFRSMVILSAAYPRSFDLLRLTWLDHLVVHTSDIDGPPSLHPDIPQRTGELLVRRRLVAEGVAMMRRLHLIDATASGAGVMYSASEDAAAVVNSVRTRYARLLNERAVWLASYLQSHDDESLSRLIDQRIGRWAIEFQSEAGPEGAQA